MSFIDRYKKKLTKERKQGFIILFTIILFFIALLVVGIVLHNQYDSRIFLNMQVFSIFNIVLFVCTVGIVFLGLRLGAVRMQFKEHEIVNNQLAKMKLERNFDELHEKYIIKEDKKFLRAKKNKKIIAIIVTVVIAFTLISYLPTIIWYKELIPIVNGWLVNLEMTVTTFKDLMLVKGIFDFIVLFPFVFAALFIGDKKREEHKEKLYKDFHEQLRKEFDLKGTFVKEDTRQFRGVEFERQPTIDITNMSKEALGPEEQLALLFDHAKLLINRYGNFRKNFGIGLLIAIEVFAIYAFLLQPEGYFVNVLYVFLLIIALTGVITDRRGNYVKKGKKVLGFDSYPKGKEELLEEELPLKHRK
jgi:hypothetical protein